MRDGQPGALRIQFSVVRAAARRAANRPRTPPAAVRPPAHHRCPRALAQEFDRAGRDQVAGLALYWPGAGRRSPLSRSPARSASSGCPPPLRRGAHPRQRPANRVAPDLLGVAKHFPPLRFLAGGSEMRGNVKNHSGTLDLFPLSARALPLE